MHPSEREKWFEHWQAERLAFHRELGFADERLRTRPHAPDELAHYARAAVDVEYLFPFGWQEIEGIHDRGDWDLSRHSQYSGKDLGITDPDTKEHYMPMVIETSVGVDRTCLALLCDAYAEEELAPGDTRVVMRFPAALAPVSVAVLPLSKKLAEPALALERELRRRFNVFYDDAGNIGRRYRRQDEAGTPYCVTIDFETGGDGKVTRARARLDGPGADRDRGRGRVRRRAAGPPGVTARRARAVARGEHARARGAQRLLLRRRARRRQRRAARPCWAGRARTSPR